MTVFGWLGLGVGGAVLFLVLALAGRGVANWWQGREWGRPNENPTPVATLESIPVTPVVTSTIAATEIISATWWVERMAPDGNGGYLLPEEARAELEADYLESVDYHGGAPWLLENEIDGRSVIDLYSTGVMREGWLGRLQQLQDGTFPSPYTDVTYGKHLVQVQNCSADGLTCTLGDMLREATLSEYDVVNRTVLKETPAAAGYDGTVILKVMYDLENARWKIAEMLDWLPAPPSGE